MPTGLALLANRYVNERVACRDLDPMTARNYRSALASLCRVFGEREPAELQPTHIRQWLVTRAHLRATTRRSDFSMVKMFCGWLREEQHVADDPLHGIRAPRPGRMEPRALPEDHVGQLLGVCPDVRARAIVWLMVGMGLRCIEVERLEVASWDRRSQLMIVCGKHDDERVLPVPGEVERALDAYLAERPVAYGPLIRSYRRPGEGLRADTISGMVSEWMRAAGIKHAPRDGVSAHALRHTCASDVLDECGDLRVVQAMLGHRNLATTSRYQRRAAAKQMAEAMAGRTYGRAG